MNREPILFTAAEARGRELTERWRGLPPTFYCVLAHTDTCLIPGLSSAGVTEELRPLTPAADAEVVILGEALCLPRLPSNPLGAPGPSGITRAALQLVGAEAHFVGAGLRVWPETVCERLGERPGGSIVGGVAVADGEQLLDVGVTLGREIASGAAYLVLGESVPAGTTTALAVLLGLGYAAEGRVSGSMPGNAHALKSRMARRALEAAGLSSHAGPMDVVGGVGDPMQPLAVGIAVGARSRGCDVLLAGGSQMLAVAALIKAIAGEAALDRIAIGTTRWVADDPSADMRGLAFDISPGLAVLAANLDFSHSRHMGLREYERFLVKEGVGAGGACIAAMLATGASVETLQQAIDVTYDSLLGRLTGVDPSHSRRR